MPRQIAHRMVNADIGVGELRTVIDVERENCGRRAADAGIETPIGCHTFRATGITDYLTNGGRIEVAVSPTAANQPGKLSGTIVGVEHQKVPAGNATVDVEVLNMWCAEGMRTVNI